MKVQVLLADRGTQNPQQGTLNLLNLGWKQTTLRASPTPVPGGLITAAHVVAVFFEVEPQRCNRPIELVISLLTEDCAPVELPSPAGPQQVRITQAVTIASPGGVPMGTPGNGNAMVEIFPGLPIPEGAYRWNVTLDGEVGEDWFASFRVRPVPGGQGGPVFGQPPPAAPSAG